MADYKLSRRSLLQNFALTVPAAILVAKSINASAEAAKPELKLVPDTDPTAKALKYVHDASKAQRTDKGGVKAKDQSCANCQFYTKAGDIAGKEVGKCLMIPSGMVKGAGWCASWAKKP